MKYLKSSGQRPFSSPNVNVYLSLKMLMKKRQNLNIKYSNKKTAMYVVLYVCMSPYNCVLTSSLKYK